MRPTSAGAFLIDDPLQSRSLVRDGQSARPAKDWATTPEDGTLWRIDPKTTITTVFALADGRMIAECHGVSQGDFDEWFKK